MATNNTSAVEEKDVTTSASTAAKDTKADVVKEEAPTAEVKKPVSKRGRKKAVKTEEAAPKKEKTTAKKRTAKTVKAEEAADTKQTAVKAADKASAKKAGEKQEETTKRKHVTKKDVVNNAKVVLQCAGQDMTQNEIVLKIVEKWCAESKKRASAIKELSIYINLEEKAAYYVINGQGGPNNKMDLA